MAPIRDEGAHEGLFGHKMFEPIEQISLKDEVVRQITDLIVACELRPGDRIPSELELAKKLGISRASVREGMQILETLGLVEVKRGVGTFVKTPMSEPALAALASSLLMSDDTILELYDVRGMIESACAARAARRASSEDITLMRDALDKLADALHGGDVDAMAACDMEFHRAVRVAAGNKLLLGLMDGIGELVRDTLRSTFRISRGLSATLDHHSRILEAIENGDADAASAATATHLREAAERVHSIMQLSDDPNGEDKARRGVDWW